MSDKKSRSKGFTQSSALIHNLLKRESSPLSQQFLRWKLWREWSDIVGPKIAKNSEPVGYYNGTLYVWVPSSVWLQEMRYIAGNMIVKINKHLGKKWARNIRFTLDRKSVPFEAQVREDMAKFIDK
ncbi:MAG: DUF721 domain-containing protein [Bdellovibrionales bacterium]